MRGFTAPLLLIPLSLILIGGYLLYSKQPLPVITSNLQRETISDYENIKLGFKFQYEKNMKVLEDSEEDFNTRGNGNFRKNFKSYVGYEPGKFLGSVVVLDSSNTYDENPLTIWVFENEDNLTIEQWYKNYWYYPFVWGDFTYTGKTVLASHEEATISGQIGKSGIIDYQSGKPKFIYVSKEGKIYLFRVIGEEGEKILETFKF